MFPNFGLVLPRIEKDVFLGRGKLFINGVSESSDRWWQLFIAVHFSVKYHIIGWVLRLALKWTILVVKRIHEGTITGAHKSVISQ